MDFNQTIQFIKQKSAVVPEVGFILGSGLGAFADAIDNKVSLPFSEIPGFKKTHVIGHDGQLILGKLCGKNVAVLKGRIHFYEGHSIDEVVFPVRVLGKLGIKTLVVTNSSGGLKKTMRPGDLMVITDHINLTGQNPLIGINDDSLGPRFPDMTEAYDKKLSKKMLSILKKFKIRHSQGVYCGVLGPSYETPAEVRFLQKIGGAAVGMSTVMEVLAARHMGIKAVGLSCITNPAAGIMKTPLDHKDVTVAAAKAQKNFIKVLVEFTKSV